MPLCEHPNPDECPNHGIVRQVKPVTEAEWAEHVTELVSRLRVASVEPGMGWLNLAADALER